MKPKNKKHARTIAAPKAETQPPQDVVVQSEPEDAKNKPPILTLKEMEELIHKPVVCTINTRGRSCVVKTRHLNPQESEILRLLMDEVMPPMIKGKAQEDDRMDVTNPEFLKRKTIAERQVRALSVFWTTPMFQEKAPELAANMYSAGARADIVRVMHSTLTDDFLDAIYAVIRMAGVTLADEITFS